MPVIEIYYAEICGLCHQAMAAFKARGLAFTAHEVHWDGKAFVDSPVVRSMYQRCGRVDFVPQIFVNGHHIAGWRKLEPMLQSGAFDRLLVLPPPD
jgi:glutaredoxin